VVRRPHTNPPLPSSSPSPRSGPDAVKFLQGLTTNDVRALQKPGDAQFTAFLNVKGRTVTEATIAAAPPHPLTVSGAGPPPASSSPSPSLLIDVHAAHKDLLFKHLRQYRLRSRVEVADLSSTHSVTALLPSSPFSPGFAAAAAKGGDPDVPLLLKHLEHAAHARAGVPHAVFVDARSPLLGVRLVGPRDVQSAGGGLDLPAGDPTDYHALRVLLGIPEGPEVSDAVPLEWNLAFLGGVSFGKGCYIGQELVARTHFRGLVRKRVVPFYATGLGAPARPPAAADAVAAALVRQTDEAMRVGSANPGGHGHGRGHGPAQTHDFPREVAGGHEQHHSRVVLHPAREAHAPGGTRPIPDRHRIRLPFPFLDRAWRGVVGVGDTVTVGAAAAAAAAASEADTEGARAGRVVGWETGTNLGLMLLRLDNVAHTFPTGGRETAAGEGEGEGEGEGAAGAGTLPAAHVWDMASDGATRSLSALHERAMGKAVDLRAGKGDSAHRLIPILPPWWRHVVAPPAEEMAGGTGKA
jgi:folate-binding protein YgfZ